MFRYLILPALLASLSAAPPSLDPGKAGFDPERLARIPVRMKYLADRQEAAGIVTLISRHGAIAEFDAVGYQDIENRKPMKTDTIFQIMSMTKPITAVGIMMLMEEGKLALNDPVERHLPEFRGQMVIAERNADGSRTLKKPSRPITIRDLMTHTSGMFDALPDGFREHNQRMNMTLAEAVRMFSQQPLEFEPGTQWKYSSPGIGVLGRIIEVASDQPYEQFLADRLFKPLEMKDSFFFPPADKIARIAMVYENKNGKLVRAGDNILGGDPTLYRKGAKYPAPEWGLYSTAADLASFYQMMLNGGTFQGRRYLSRASVKLMSQVHTGTIAKAGWMGGTGYGLAWEVVNDPQGELMLNSLGTYGHGGAFGTQGWIDPQRDLIRIMLVQRSGGADVVRNAFMPMAVAACNDCE